MIHVGSENARTFYTNRLFMHAPFRSVSSRRFHLFTSLRGGREENDLTHATLYRAHCSLYSDWQSRALPTLNSVRWHGAKSSRPFVTARFTSCAFVRTFRVGGHPDNNIVEKTWQRKSFCVSGLYVHTYVRLVPRDAARCSILKNLEINIKRRYPRVYKEEQVIVLPFQVLSTNVD